MVYRSISIIACTVLLGCGPETSATSDTDATETGTEPVCVPGTVQACPCVGGEQGSQTCNTDGAGFGECVCPAGSSGAQTTDTGIQTTDDTTSTSAETDDTTGTQTTGGMGCTDCSQVDMLFVIDNSGSMGEEQRKLAQMMPLLVEQIENLTDANDDPLPLDVQVMFTTTDFGNPLCTPFEPPGYNPARGEPISSACSGRIQDFTDLIGTTMMPEVCMDGCPMAVEPTDDFVAFSGSGPADNNIPDTPDVDIDGDGIDDGEVARALACLLPQGINGCGYESQLENMLQALNPAAAWNQGAAPFLRDDAMLAVVVLTDEADCSVMDYSIMDDPSFQNINPDTGTPAASSALCWNAGVTCIGPDMFGVYSNCTSNIAENLQPITRYTNYLVNELRENQGKEVMMLGMVGIPEVTNHDPSFPHQPIAGGTFDLVYRNWVDGQYPAGDILPDEFAEGETAADKQFDFGIGPGCTGEDGPGGFTGQALPPVRLREVCEALNMGGAKGARCCLESVCDTEYDESITCLTNLIRNAS